jgi:hypothetical protein
VSDPGIGVTTKITDNGVRGDKESSVGEGFIPSRTQSGI